MIDLVGILLALCFMSSIMLGIYLVSQRYEYKALQFGLNVINIIILMILLLSFFEYISKHSISWIGYMGISGAIIFLPISVILTRKGKEMVFKEDSILMDPPQRDKYLQMSPREEKKYLKSIR
ncbi:hypothetical protein SAMN04487866_12611 [Thermoactinomyces sp. DSM 45891]|uniref:hypothetical protein n=1 Tax=Thermoactinomyces sp. DSM 45891 TaxID=1761907 RepID=UPI00091BF02D|nr:hypothetical protein [Thermoactinomyces sp. DSM 45891]SFX79253.1 hypothetical protein SAMN04487866_12611 [Thermoactinomyces sp. DSM 45891]